MNVLKTFAVVGAVIGGLIAWDAFKPEGGVKAMVEDVQAHFSSRSGNGEFVQLPPPDGMSPNEVVIFTPRNCPSEQAQRARELMRQLAAEYRRKRS